MDAEKLAQIILFFSGMLMGLGLLFGLIAAVIYFFEDKLL